MFVRYLPSDSPVYVIEEEARATRRGLWATFSLSHRGSGGGTLTKASSLRRLAVRACRLLPASPLQAASVRVPDLPLLKSD